MSSQCEKDIARILGIGFVIGLAFACIMSLFIDANRNFTVVDIQTQLDKAEQVCQGNGGVKSFELAVGFEGHIDPESPENNNYGDVICNNNAHFDL